MTFLIITLLSTISTYVFFKLIALVLNTKIKNLFDYKDPSLFEGVDIILLMYNALIILITFFIFLLMYLLIISK
jgi:hypothetical protein